MLDGVAGASRRLFMSNVGKAALSATAVGLIAGCQSQAATTMESSDQMAADVGILNVALGLEDEAISAYQIGAESGLLQPDIVKVAVMFQSQHKEHRDVLTQAITSLGGTPVEAKSQSQYASELGASSLKNQTDVLMLAAKLEKGAANAYIGVLPQFHDRDLSKASGRIAADEVMHWTVLTQALGQALPKKALSFGA